MEKKLYLIGAIYEMVVGLLYLLAGLTFPVWHSSVSSLVVWEWFAQLGPGPIIAAGCLFLVMGKLMLNHTRSLKGDHNGNSHTANAG